MTLPILRKVERRARILEFKIAKDSIRSLTSYFVNAIALARDKYLSSLLKAIELKGAIEFEKATEFKVAHY